MVPAYCLALQFPNTAQLGSCDQLGLDLQETWEDIFQACSVLLGKPGPCSLLAASQGVLSASRGHLYSYLMARFIWNACGTCGVLRFLSLLTLSCGCLGISNFRGSPRWSWLTRLLHIVRFTEWTRTPPAQSRS